MIKNALSKNSKGIAKSKSNSLTCLYNEIKLEGQRHYFLGKQSNLGKEKIRKNKAEKFLSSVTGIYFLWSANHFLFISTTNKKWRNID